MPGIQVNIHCTGKYLAFSRYPDIKILIKALNAFKIMKTGNSIKYVHY